MNTTRMDRRFFTSTGWQKYKSRLHVPERRAELGVLAIAGERGDPAGCFTSGKAVILISPGAG